MKRREFIHAYGRCGSGLAARCLCPGARQGLAHGLPRAGLREILRRAVRRPEGPRLSGRPQPDGRAPLCRGTLGTLPGICRRDGAAEGRRDCRLDDACGFRRQKPGDQYSGGFSQRHQSGRERPHRKPCASRRQHHGRRSADRGAEHQASRNSQGSRARAVARRGALEWRESGARLSLEADTGCRRRAGRGA